MMDITLTKEKYRNNDRRLLRRGSAHGQAGKFIDPPEGTWVFNGGRFKAHSDNSGHASKIIPIRPRRKAYGPW